MTDWRIIEGDSAEVLQGLEDCSIDGAFTDPPYGWKFMQRNWDAALPDPAIWRECLRVLKPGGAACVMSGPRLDCLWRVCRDLEAAGFELAQTAYCHVYRSGFPKGANFSVMADQRAGVERTEGAREWRGGQRTGGILGKESGGCGTNLGTQTLVKYDAPATPLASALSGQFSKGKIKPAFELIIWARKPISEKTEFDNVVRWGTGAVNCGECMVPYDADTKPKGGYGGMKVGMGQIGETQDYSGEQQANPSGRFPANVLCQDNALGEGSKYFSISAWAAEHGFGEEGWAEAAEAGLIQVPKASKAERHKGLELPDSEVKMYARPCDWEGANWKGNNHPCCKPTRLFSYIIELLCPAGGTVLDPFCGSGSTGVAAIQCGRQFIGVEMEPEYVAIAEARCKWAEQNQPAQQAMEI